MGTLLAGDFCKRAIGLAYDGDHRIIYETDTGRLDYNNNGGLVGIVRLTPNLALTRSDFFVV